MADEPRPEVKVDAKSKSTVQVEHVDRQTPTPFGTGPVKADVFKLGTLKSLPFWVVALSIKDKLENALVDIRAAGAIATSSGGIRDLGAGTGAGRSDTSFHYVGLAIDLYMYGAMNDPDTDPYIVTADPDVGNWRVFARTNQTTVKPATFLAFKKKFVPKPKGSKLTEFVKVSEVETTGSFVDLTALFAKHNFKRIPAQENFLKDANARHYPSAEWWHFQQEDGLVPGKTTFGSLLLRVRTEAELKDTGPGLLRNKVWNGKTFV
jgi:hypothetical protein